MRKIESEFTRALLRATTYRAFMAMFFVKQGLPRSEGQPKPLSYAEFSRRAGFSSRSFIREIILGQRRINPGNFDKICLGLGLDSILKDYFKILVSIEESRFRGRANVDLRQLLEVKREKVVKSLGTVKLNRDKIATKELLSLNVPLVYAALGDIAGGATLKDIVRRTGKNESAVLSAIKKLSKLELLSVREGRYYPCSLHVAIDRLGGDAYFKADFERSLKELARRYDILNGRKDTLLLSSTFCVNENDLVILRLRLNDVITDYINGAEVSTGDRLVELTVGFRPTATTT